MNLLEAAGLSETEAKVYLELLKQRQWKPADLAKSVNESRTNCYKLLDNLVSKGLAEKSDVGTTLRYSAAHPSQLTALMQEKTAQTNQAISSLNARLPSLISEFTKMSELPGVKVFVGRQQIRGIFQDILDTREDVYFIRSQHDLDIYDDQFFEKLKAKKAELHITTHALTSLNKDTIAIAEHDEEFNMVRSWLPHGSYTAPVEWNIYGDKTAIIIYGEEEIALQIHSPSLAESMRQLFKIIAKRQKL